MPGSADVEEAIKAHLPGSQVQVEDISSGCGTSFQVGVVASEFAGKRPIERHRIINAALKDLMPDIHALTISRALTPEQAA